MFEMIFHNGLISYARFKGKGKGTLWCVDIFKLGVVSNYNFAFSGIKINELSKAL